MLGLGHNHSELRGPMPVAALHSGVQTLIEGHFPRHLVKVSGLWCWPRAWLGALTLRDQQAKTDTKDRRHSCGFLLYFKDSHFFVCVAVRQQASVRNR